MQNPIRFFMPMQKVPTVTHQEKRVALRGGKPVFYEGPELKDARAKLTAYLAKHRPDAPLDGPLKLKAAWMFPAEGAHEGGEYRTSRPDTDNLNKLLKDCMTRCGFWQDDAQVCFEIIVKLWSAGTPGILIEVTPLDRRYDSADVTR